MRTVWLRLGGGRWRRGYWCWGEDWDRVDDRLGDGHLVVLLADVLDDTLALRDEPRVGDEAASETVGNNTPTSGYHSLEVLEALLVRSLLTDLLGELHQGGVALLPQPRVATGDDLLPVLGHGHRLQQHT